jgi:hypothetical protein
VARVPLGIPMDVYRGEDGSYHVEADLPGAGLDSVEVTVEHVVLTIQAGRTSHYGDTPPSGRAPRIRSRSAAPGSCPPSRTPAAWPRWPTSPPGQAAST